MANSKEHNDIKTHMSQLRSYVNSCEGRRNNTVELLNEKEALTDALNKLKSEDINLIEERKNIVEEIIRQDERMIVLLQCQRKNECFKEANSKIMEENDELKKKIKKIRESTTELIKDNGLLTAEYLETKTKEAATIEQNIDKKLDRMRELWLATNDGYKLVTKQYETKVKTLRAKITKLESMKKSFENRFTSKQMYYERKFINDKDNVRSLAEYSAKYASKRGEEDMATAILDATIYPQIFEDDSVLLEEDSAETIPKQSDEDMVLDVPTNGKSEAATAPLINDTNNVKSLAEDSAETITKQGDEDIVTDPPINVKSEPATAPLINDTNTVKSLAEDSAETITKQSDEDIVTDPPTFVQFERRAFISDTVHVNILGNQNIESNTNCYKQMKPVSARSVDPTNSCARTRVYVRKGGR